MHVGPAIVHPHRSLIRSVCAALVLSGTLVSQPGWLRKDTIPERHRHAVAYDSIRDRTVLFGGADNASVFGNTWERVGVTWVLREPATSPPAMTATALAFDSARGRTVLFGGTPIGQPASADT